MSRFWPEATVCLKRDPTRLFTVVDVGPIINCYPKGGGFTHHIPAEELEIVPPTPPIWHLAIFRIDDGPEFRGYSCGQRWNGWACPAFTLEVAHSLCSELLENFIWDEARGMFCDNTYEDEPQMYSGEVITVDGKPVTVFALGACSICWDEYPINQSND